MQSPDIPTYPATPATTFDPATEMLQAELRRLATVQVVEVRQHAGGMGTPERQWDMGWKAPLIGNEDITRKYILAQAPEPPYTVGKYSNLVAQAAQPKPTTQPAATYANLRAPGINEGFGYNG